METLRELCQAYASRGWTAETGFINALPDQHMHWALPAYTVRAIAKFPLDRRCTNSLWYESLLGATTEHSLHRRP